MAKSPTKNFCCKKHLHELKKTLIQLVSTLSLRILPFSAFAYVMRCAIWYHLYNLKNVKNAHGGVLKFKPATLKVTLLHGCFSCFVNRKKTSHIIKPLLLQEISQCSLALLPNLHETLWKLKVKTFSPSNEMIKQAFLTDFFSYKFLC